MPLITETYYLSLTQDNRGILRLRCSQNDTLRTANLKLYNNGSTFTIPSGISAYVSGVKQNGAVFSKPCTISQNRESVVLQLSSDITNVDGIIVAEIVLNDGNGDRLGTSNFIIQVEKNPIRAGVIQDTETPIEYVNDFITQIQALTARVNNLITPNGDPSLAEVVDARISSLDNNTYQNLKARIDADIATLNTRKANKSEVYTKSQVDNLLENVEIDVDNELSDKSENPVQNKVINRAIGKLKADLDAQVESINESLQIQRNVAVLEQGNYSKFVNKYGTDGGLNNCYVPITNNIGVNIYEAAYQAQTDTVEWHRIPVSNATKIVYPVNKTSYDYGSIFTDISYNIISGHANHTLDSGSNYEIDVPEGAAYFFWMLPQSLISIKDTLTVTIYRTEEITDSTFYTKTQVDDFINGQVNLTYSNVVDRYGTDEDLANSYVDIPSGIDKNIYTARWLTADTVEWHKIFVRGASKITYPANKTSYNYGSIFTDKNYNIISGHANHELTSGSMLTLDVPETAEYFFWMLPQSLISIKDTLTVIIKYKDTSKILTEAQPGFLPYNTTLFGNAEKTSLVLCAVKYEYADNKIPFASGYLFHEMNSDDNSMYFGTKLDNAAKVGTVPFDVDTYVYGISPKDGRVICGRREDKGTLYVWDGTTATPLFANASRKPYGWLYNTGIEFIQNGDVEYCIFAEYAHTPSQDGLYVWKGTYPYTSESDWKTVYYHQSVTNDETVGSIRHFHFVRRDPWTDVLYLGSGDNPNQINWWYSTDYGENWTLLFNNSNVGWEEHIGRCCNIVFTDETAYWASDRDINHCLNSMERDSSTGVLSPSTRKRLCALPAGQATNSICYAEYPRGLFMFDRFDGYESARPYYGNPLVVTFYSLDDSELKTVCKMEKEYGWGGHRGKCYTNYVSGQENRPAMGFSADTPCIFTFIGASNKIGTLFYEL